MFSEQPTDDALSARLVSWLSALPHISDVSPVIVTIGKQTYIAARYTATHQTPPMSRAYQSGERTYQSEMIYCIGDLPRCYVRRRKTCFTGIDAREWFIAGYWEGNLGDILRQINNTEYHPFGPTFMLSPWTSSEPIDHYETHKYTRVPVTLA